MLLRPNVTKTKCYLDQSLLDKYELDKNELDKSELRRKCTRRNVTEPIFRRFSYTSFNFFKQSCLLNVIFSMTPWAKSNIGINYHDYNVSCYLLTKYYLFGSNANWEFEIA